MKQQPVKFLLLMLVPLVMFSGCLGSSLLALLFGETGDTTSTPNSITSSGTHKAESSDEAFVRNTLDAATGVKPKPQPQPVVKKTGAFTDKVIAIPSPRMDTSTKADAWIPQFMQDTLTNNFVRLSSMRVIDRRNEQLAIAEQQLGESGFYDLDSAAQIGQMTNAEYVLAGTIQRLPTSYSLNFRVNHITTNEIRSSFSGQYSQAQIESGLAARDAIVALFAGLEIPLMQAEIDSMVSDRGQYTSVKKLAQGSVYEKDDDFFAAISLYLESGTAEGSQNTNRILGDNMPASIQARAAYYNAQREKWQKIFAELKAYMEDGEHLPIFIYDFSQKEFNLHLDYFSYTVAPGIKVVPNRSAVALYHTISKAWEETSSKEENKVWALGLRFPNVSFWFSVTVDLFDEYGDSIEQVKFFIGEGGPNEFYNFKKNIQVKAQVKYFNDSRFNEIDFSVIKLSKISATSGEDDLHPKITGIFFRDQNKPIKNPVVMTVNEFYAFCEQNQVL